MSTAAAILYYAGVWIAIGALISTVFLTIGIDRLDEDAQGAYVFRVLLVPALLLIWPAVLWRWYILERGRDEWPKRHTPPRDAHFWVAILFAVSIPCIILLGLSQRQTWPSDFAPQQLSTGKEQSQ